MIAKSHRVPRITMRDLALIFRLIAHAAIAVELERHAQSLRPAPPIVPGPRHFLEAERERWGLDDRSTP